MKILHISYFGAGGAGGAISMRRLHFALRNSGIDSKVLCAKGAVPSSEMISVKGSRIGTKLDSLSRRSMSRIGLNGIIPLNSARISRHKAYQQADIVNFHRIFDFFSYTSLPRLTENKLSVLTICDMWPYTGHCYHSLDCERWQTGCGNCPYPDTIPSIRMDNTHLEWKLKKRAYSHSNLHIVSKSSWTTEQLKKSMLNLFPVHHIPNGIDTEIYRALDKKQCRSLLAIPHDKKVLAFVAHGLKRYEKGADLLLQALQKLPQTLQGEIILVLLGHHGLELADSVDVQTINFNYVASGHLKAICYSAADLNLHPARAEVLGNTILESIACGTPVVSFKVGGIPDIVRPGITGYLAEPENVGDFRDGIVELLEDETRRIRMNQQCREIALNEYSLKLWVKRYIKLYKHLLQR